MTKTILTYQPYLEMISHSSHTNLIVNEFLTLIIGVVSFSFMAENFVTYKKLLTKWCYTLKDLSSFWDYSKFFRAGWENIIKILKTARKVQLQAWQFTSRTPLYGCSQSKWLLFGKFKNRAPLMFGFNVECAFKQIEAAEDIS